jgi:hypothetical protein
MSEKSLPNTKLIPERCGQDSLDDDPAVVFDCPEADTL